MIISEIGIKGFKSFGNNEQVFKLDTDSGKLILLAGHNGSGKTSFLSSFEFSLYGKVRGGKTKKWATLSSIPNRINGETLNYIKFKSNNTDVMVKRGIGPNVLELWENDIENTRAGKSNIDTKIEEYIGMDLETFKSFISMSISDFKNFISLSNEEKKMLLDKLFNLEVINTLSSISKDLNKVNKSTLTILDSDISTLEDSINSIQTSIEKTLSKQKEQKEQGLKEEIESLKEIINSKKEEFLSLKTKIEKITDKRTEINSDIEKEKEEYYKIKSSVSKITEEIKLYDSGKCPTCKTDFTSDHFMTLRSTLVEKLDSVNKIKETIESNSKELKEKKTKLDDLFTKTNESFGSLKFLLSSTKEKIAKLTVRLENSDTESDKTGIEEFEKSISELEERIKQNKDKKNVCSEKELIYKELNNIFGESGVKKSIISNIIKPINKYISENVKQMGIPFSVELDNTFSAEIKHLGVVIDPETLSMGETRRINIAIIVAYLKLIRTKKHINILFLDEVFASIDLDGIESILSLLKTFAEEYKINIFVVHHAILNEEVFDRIFKVNKNVFTTIEEIKTIQ